MSELREAAQAALEHWDKVSGIFRMTTETNRLRAALALPETEAEPVMWMNRYDATMKTRDRVTANAMGFTIPLYTHPPRDIEPPTEGDEVMSINETISDALFDYCIAWRDRASAAQDKVEAELRAAIEQHVAEAVAMEREECALICDAEGREWDSDAVVTLKNYAEHCAAAIRARADNEVTK